MNLLVGEAICALLGNQGGSWNPLVDFLVARVFYMLPGQWGTFRNLLIYFLVGRVIHTLQRHQGRYWQLLVDFPLMTVQEQVLGNLMNFLVTEEFLHPLGQWWWVGPAGGITSGWICLSPSWSVAG